jgi:hypothetical protein
MKTTIYSLLAAAACGIAFGQTAYTTPVGYETITLAPGTYNLTGVRLFNPQVAAGTFESNTATTLVDNQASFSLTSTKNYIVEFPSGATITALGSDFVGTTLSNLTGINASYLGAYVVREALTIASVFGSTNQAGLASSANANPVEADLIYLPDGAGGFVQIFYSTFVDTEAAPEDQLNFFGWLNASSFAKVSNEVIYPERGYFVQTQGSVSPVVFTITGEVKKTPTTIIANDSFSLVSGLYPAGATLANSGLSSIIQGSANANPVEADVLLLPDGAGGFVQCFYSTFVDTEAAPEDQLNFFGWLNATSFDKIPNQSLTPGYFIQKVGPNILGTHTQPSFYNNL